MKKSLLHRLLLVIVIIGFSFTESKAQYITIPDPNLATWMRTHGYDTCMIGNQLDTTKAKKVYIKATDLNLSNLGLIDVFGIKYIKGGSTLTNPFQRLNLSHNNLTEFPNEALYNAGSKYLDLSYNKIDTFTLRYELRGLAVLNMSHNAMKKFMLDWVYYSSYSYSVFTISGILLDYNELDSMPDFYTSYNGGHSLHLRGNKLTRVPKGNYGYLDCGNNRITKMECRSNCTFIVNFFIDSNLIAGNVDYKAVFGSKAPNRFNCSNNGITSITNIHFAEEFLCYNNNITGKLDLPDRISVLDCHNNPNLQCISGFSPVTSYNLNYSNTGIQCLPPPYPYCNYTSTPALNAVPTCDMYNNVYGCDVIPKMSGISGTVYGDVIANCKRDTVERGQPNAKVYLMQNGTVADQVYTDAKGFYFFDSLSFGAYEVAIDTLASFYRVLCPDSAYYATYIDSANYLRQSVDFGLTCDFSAIDIASALDIPMLRPGFYVQMPILAGIVNQIDLCPKKSSAGELKVTYSGPIQYQGNAGLNNPTTVNGNTVTWSVTEFGARNGQDFILWFLVDSTAQAGDQVCFDVTVIPVTPDYDATNNYFKLCSNVRTSYDPNDKTVYPSGDILDTTEWLNYSVRFQNTGNAPARHVYVIDTLSSSFDLSSFRVLGSSHANVTQVSEQGVVKFNFPFIELPDSVHDEPNSHGYIQYKVKLKPNLPTGTGIDNTAHIYFDYNAAVVTNTTHNEIVDSIIIPEYLKIAGPVLPDDIIKASYPFLANTESNTLIDTGLYKPLVYYRKKHTTTFAKAAGSVLFSIPPVTNFVFSIKAAQLGGLMDLDTIEYFYAAQTISGLYTTLPVGGSGTDINNLSIYPGTLYSFVVHEADTNEPEIVVTPIALKRSADALLHIQVTDNKGTDMSAGKSPVVYFKKYKAGSFVKQDMDFHNGNAQNCEWEALLDASLSGGWSDGDTILYYVAAQDMAFPTVNTGSAPKGIKATSVVQVSKHPDSLYYFVYVEDSVTALPDVKDNVSMHYNAAERTLVIQSGSGKSQNRNVDVYNVLGQVVFSQHIKVSAAQRAIISLSSLPASQVYFAVITDEAGQRGILKIY